MEQSFVVVVLKKLYLNEHASDERYTHAMGLVCKLTSPVHSLVRKIAGEGPLLGA